MAEDAPRGPALRGVDITLLAAVIALYAAAVAALSYLHYEDFQTFNWDLGIAMQSMWSTAHGGLMFNTGGLITLGYRSYLAVNSAFIGLPLALVYGIFPDALTLFLIQSIAFSLSAVPLFLIIRFHAGSRSAALPLVLLYLSSFAVLSGLFYDFHWEAFIPLEYFSFYYLLARRRILLSLIPFAAGSLTLQLFPPLAGAVILLLVWNTLSGRRTGDERRWMLALALYAVAAAGAFIALEAAQSLIASSPLTSGSTLHYISTGKFGSTPFQLFPGLSLVYWLLLLSSAGFLPLLSPRHLLLSLPWFVESVFLFSRYSSFFGNQYSLIAFPPLFIAAAAGIGRIRDRSLPRRLLLVPACAAAVSIFIAVTGVVRSLLDPEELWQLLIIAVLSPLALFILCYSSLFPVRYSIQGSTLLSRMKGRRAVHAKTLLTALIVSLLLFNMVMGPLNPENYGATRFPGYSVSIHLNPSAAYLHDLTSLVSGRPTMLVSNNLMPYVANDPNAYSLLSPYSKIKPPYFPFTPASLPEFVFTDSCEAGIMPSFILGDLFNSTVYGLRAYIFNPGFPGTIYLFQLGYGAQPVSYVSVPPPSSYYFSYRNLSTGPSGRVVADRTSMFGRVIESVNGRALQPGNVNNASIWYGPYITLLPGEYRVTFSLSGQGATPGALLYMDGSSYGLPYYYSSDVNATAVSGSGWSEISFTMNISLPFLMNEFRGYLIYRGGAPAGTVYLNYIRLQRI